MGYKVKLFMAWTLYAILIAPLAVVTFMNQAFEPLNPTVRFSDLPNSIR